MTIKQITILEGFKGFIEWSIENKRDFSWILANLNHDIVGLSQEDKFFSPRTKGYNKEK